MLYWICYPQRMKLYRRPKTITIWNLIFGFRIQYSIYMVHLIFKHRNKPVSAYKETWMQENGLYKETCMQENGLYKESWMQENGLQGNLNARKGTTKKLECKKTD